MGDGKKQVILLCTLIIVLFIAGCQGKSLESITGNVVQEPNAQYPTPNAQLPTTDLVVGCADSDGGDEPSVAGTTTVLYWSGKRAFRTGHGYSLGKALEHYHATSTTTPSPSSAAA